MCGDEKDFKNSIFSDTHHITLEKERRIAKKEGKQTWNDY
tara:strand:+ start:1968 stop:2087 length:120 start_codon:yes stop_codon:yes gene_type:complete